MAGDLLTTLPIDVLLRIAAYLDSHSLELSLGPTSRLLYAVATESTVWGQIVVSPCCVQELVRLIDKRPQIAVLDISQLQLSPYAEADVLCDLPNLIYVDVGANRLNDWQLSSRQQLASIRGDAGVWRAAVSAGATLTSVEGLVSEAVPASASELCPNLTRLSGASLPVDGFPNLVVLRTLDVCVSDADWNGFVANHTRLRSLEVGRFVVPAAGEATDSVSLHALLQFPSSLTHLRLSNRDVDFDASVHGFLSSSPSITSLRVTVLNDCVVADLEHLHQPLKSLEFEIVALDKDGLNQLNSRCTLEKLVCQSFGGVSPDLVPALQLPVTLRVRGGGLDAAIRSVGRDGLWRLRELEVDSVLSDEALRNLGEGAKHLKHLALWVVQNSYAELAEACGGLVSLKSYGVAGDMGGAAAVALAAAATIRSVTVAGLGCEAVLCALLPAVAPRRLDTLACTTVTHTILLAVEEFANAGGSVVSFQLSAKMGLQALIHQAPQRTARPDLASQLSAHRGAECWDS